MLDVIAKSCINNKVQNLSLPSSTAMRQYFIIITQPPDFEAGFASNVVLPVSLRVPFK
jgi:hypothetical protein